LIRNPVKFSQVRALYLLGANSALAVGLGPVTLLKGVEKRDRPDHVVIPAQAGIQKSLISLEPPDWIPA
jgi:hypothetical protein